MHRYKMARWRRILRRSTFRRRQIRSIRHLRHSRSRLSRIYSTVVLTIAWLVLPFLPGCGAEPAKTTASQSGSPATIDPPTITPSSPESSPTVLTLGSNSDQGIRFRGVDNEYQGFTQVLPDGQIVHQRDQHD